MGPVKKLLLQSTARDPIPTLLPSAAGGFSTCRLNLRPAVLRSPPRHPPSKGSTAPAAYQPGASSPPPTFGELPGDGSPTLASGNFLGDAPRRTSRERFQLLGKKSISNPKLIEVWRNEP
jgi:hypothetical protein